ncbi:MAG: AAA family ATPase [Micropruina sp.]|uniref:AAA family ATPase n=1 Tax=Micropruina sp. TaxID=2737536 RepID=UPI0039E3894D
MRVRVIGAGVRAGDEPDSFVLEHDRWNDWWKYQTQYWVTYVDERRQSVEIGQVKIAQYHQAEAAPILPETFTGRPDGIFSVGQDVSYYENLRALGQERSSWLLATLGDIAVDTDVRRMVLGLDVTTQSLLRNVPLETVRGQFARIAKGGARLTEYNFRYKRAATSEKGGVELSFKVAPESRPPSNIHVIIGRNGAGKSTLLGDILAAFRQRTNLGAKIASVVSVSFSAFDSFGTEGLRGDSSVRPARYIGLKRPRMDPDGPQDLKSDVDLAEELRESLQECVHGARKERLIRAIEILENDPIFAEAGLRNMLKRPVVEVDAVADPYRRLSSGHKIVLLTTTRLVETIEEKTLVLIDEPEAHLHPPLLSAFVRALSDLLSNRNGLAIVATHSPVVLQEVPSNCVWKVSRSGRETSVTRPSLETFGENVGTLTHEVFGLEVRGTGFYQMLSEIALDSFDYNTALAELGYHLGQEGRAILRAQMLLARRQEA